MEQDKRSVQAPIWLWVNLAALGCQDRGKNPQNNRDKNPQDKCSTVG
jgi:hypothetical protein